MIKHYDRFIGQVAIVTGSGTGIGKELAKGFAAEGATVVNVGRRLDKIEQTTNEIIEAGGKAVSMQCDISKEEQCRRVIQDTIKEFGKLDILINNASIFPEVDFLECTGDIWRKTVDINLNGTFCMCHEAVPEMLKRNSGNIINIVTGYVRMGSPRTPHYGCSKAGVMLLTRAIAAAYGQQGIRCNAIAPGSTPNTEGCIALGLDTSFREEWDKTIPLGRYAENDEYVGLAVFLASEDSAFITGQTISADGGMTMY